MKDDNNIPNKIYINLKHKEKLLVLKLDWFHMHGGRRKCKCAKPKHITGECYMNVKQGSTIIMVLGSVEDDRTFFHNQLHEIKTV
jgi:hypothetical protein